MAIRKILLYIALIISSTLFAQKDSISVKKEKAFAIVPLITSTPLMGVGFGLTTSYLYQGDKSQASKSQLNAGGQYTTTESYSVFATNNLWLRDNKFRLVTMLSYSGINNEFEEDGDNVEYNINTTLFSQLQMMRVYKNVYAGIPLLYKRITYKPNNEFGEDFIQKNGIENERTGGFGLAGTYDSRKNKYYPTNSLFITTRWDIYPEWLGAVQDYNKVIINARGYIDGFSREDVLAMQLYGEYASYFAPDAGLPAISGKSILRGFPQGQLKARYMTGGQAEYRYTIGQSRFRAVGFFGLVNLAGGSYGDGVNSRDDDGWYNAVGLGARYKLQQITGVDIRLDFVRTSLDDYAVYLKLNQAF